MSEGCSNLESPEVNHDFWSDLASLDTNLAEKAEDPDAAVGAKQSDLVLYFPVSPIDGTSAKGPVFVGKTIDSSPDRQVVESPNGHLLEEPLAEAPVADAAEISRNIAWLRRIERTVAEEMNKLEQAMKGLWNQSSIYKYYQTRFNKKKSELGRLQKEIEAYQKALDLVGKGETGWCSPDHPIVKKWEHTIPGFVMPKLKANKSTKR